MVQCIERCKCPRVTCADVNLEHDDPASFIRPQFGPTWTVIVWYGLWCAYFTATTFVDIFVLQKDSRHVWLAVFSNWNYLLAIGTTMVEVVVRGYVLVRHKATLDGDRGVIPWYFKMQWVLYNTSCSISILASVMVLAVVKSDPTFSCVNKHLSTCIYVITNSLAVTSIPTKLLHFYQPMIFATSYLVFAAIFQSAHRTEEYQKIYDWDKTFEAAILSCSTVIVIVPLIHGLFYCLFKLRIFIRHRCFGSIENKSQHSPKPSVRRDITATDVVLEEDSRNYHYIDVQPDIKDDTNLKLSAELERSALQQLNPRLLKSETDLRNYRTKNGFYCEFAKSSPISHYSNPCYEKEIEKYDQNENFRGTHIIRVKKCNTPTSSIQGDNSSDTLSNASSDYLSQYIEEDLLAYYL